MVLSGACLYFNIDVGRYLRVELDSDLKQACILDRACDDDLLLVDLEAFLLEAVGNILSRNGTIKSSVSTASGDDLENLAVKDLLILLGSSQSPALVLCLGACLELYFVKIGGSYFLGKSFLKEEIPRIAVAYVNDLIGLTYILYI